MIQVYSIILQTAELTLNNALDYRTNGPYRTF